MSCRGTIQPEQLPTTEQAAYFHGLRTFIQVMGGRWKDNINAEDLGCRKNGDCLYPVKTNAVYAPSYLQQIVRCNCKMTTKNPCGINKCSCVSACGGYCGKDCNNCASQQESSQVACPEPLEFHQHGLSLTRHWFFNLLSRQIQISSWHNIEVTSCLHLL